MEDERLLERERYQMEQIRQLEYEELQVEEVDDEASEDDDPMLGEPTSPAEFNYDTSLAALHSYLGDVEDSRNRFSFLDGGAVIDIPLFYLEGVVLFPEATLPLRVVQSSFIAAVEKALRDHNGHYTIGVIRVHRDSHDSRIKFATTGTTAEIRQYRRLEDGSLNVVTRGQQRFRLRRRYMDVDGAPCGEIQIIQEDTPLRTPRDAVGRLIPLRRSQAGAGVKLQAKSSNVSPMEHYGCGNGNDSDAMSEESFEGRLSSGERRLHRSAIVSNIGENMSDESTSSDYDDDDDDDDGSRKHEMRETDLSSQRLALGLNASGPLNLEDVKNAYRSCALKWHPDRHQGPSKVVAEEKFKACSSAYQSLCDNISLN